MRYRKLGNTDLEVSVVCLGTWVFGGDFWGGAEDTESLKVAEDAIERGINFIDTAPVYGFGRSEEIVGRAIKGKADKVVIATKLGLEGRGKDVRPNLSAPFIRKEIEDSLRRLGVEKIDLYQCHWPDPKTPLEETLGEMKKLVEEGKIRCIGVSNFDKVLMEKATEIAPVVSDQMQYSLLDRKIEEDLMPFCREKGISILAYGPLGGGILTGKYKKPPAFPKGDARSLFYTFYSEPNWSKARALVDVLEDIASKRGVSTSQVAINWVLSHEEVASCLAGCRTTQQLEQNLQAGAWELTEEELARIQREYSCIFDVGC